MTPRDLARLRQGWIDESLDTDSLAEHLEFRVMAIEAVIAARWPRRILVRWRLARRIRRSVRYFPGATFAEKRVAAVTQDWLSDAPARGGEGK